MGIETKKQKKIQADIAVIGAGPGGYSAAFRAADLGKSVVLIEKNAYLGGVCLNIGCIPSKTLLHAAEVIETSQQAAAAGIHFQPPKIDLDELRKHKNEIVGKLQQGVNSLADGRKVQVVQGTAEFIDSTHLLVTSGNSGGNSTEKNTDGKTRIEAEQIIIASGSEPVKLPDFPYDDPRVWTSTEALELNSIPDHLMIVGGGIIGLEMASIYHALGSSISIVEMTDQLIPPADADLVRPLQKKLKKIAEGIYTSTKVTGVESGKKKLALYLDGKKAPEKIEGDAVLIAVGRRANSGNLGLEKAGIEADERGIIPVNARQQTNVPNIYAVGDVTGGPMLAHRGSYQGKIAAEAAAGRASAYSVMSVPSIAYTHPEVAWVGLTEKEAKQQGISYQKGVFPWQASGRALSSDATDGMTKVLFDEESGRLIGAGITGLNAGELLAEAVLALEMGSTAEDIALTMHAHPTLSETFGLAAEIVDGSITEMMNKK